MTFFAAIGFAAYLWFMFLIGWRMGETADHLWDAWTTGPQLTKFILQYELLHEIRSQA